MDSTVRFTELGCKLTTKTVYLCISSVYLCFSNVSTSSSWSWPTHHEDPRDVGDEGEEAGGMLEVGKDGSRRYSHLPPAKVKLVLDILDSLLEISSISDN